MALYAMADNNVDIPAERDAAMYNVMLGKQDFIIADIGNEFECSYSASAFLITLSTGEAVMCGRHVTEVTESNANTTLQLSANDSGYIVLRFDLTKPAGQEAYLVTTNTLYSQDLNNGGTLRDLPLYQYVTNATGVSSMIDVRTIKSAVSGSKTVDVTLLASGWSSDVYTLNDSNIVTTGNITVGYPVSITDTQFSELQDAVIRCTAISTGTMTFKATGGAPSVDIPIQLIIWG